MVDMVVKKIWERTDALKKASDLCYKLTIIRKEIWINIVRKYSQ